MKIGLCVLVLSTIICSCSYPQNSDSRYERLTEKGYFGTEEQLIASLVGDQVEDNVRGKSAYEMGVELGFNGSFDEWIFILTDKHESDETKSAYQVICEHGYKGKLLDYLESIIKNVNDLGKSEIIETEYERAVSNGFTGNYIEWLISLV